MVDFRNTVVIMTSNIGSQYIVEAGAEAGGAEWTGVEEQVRDELRSHFRPEFLNRVDDIIVFRPLSRQEIGAIVEIQLAKLAKLLADRQIGLDLTPEARAWLADEGYDPVYGARPLKRVIQRSLQNPIALEVLEGNFHDGDTIRVERDGDRLRFVRADRPSARPAPPEQAAVGA